MRYAGGETWFTPRRLGLILLVPALSAAILIANALQGWHPLGPGAPLPPVGTVPQPLGLWLYIQLGGALLLIVAGAHQLLRSIACSPGSRPAQMAAVLLSVVLPLVAAATHAANVEPALRLDPTPLTLPISGILLAWGLYRYRLIDLAPLARDAVIDSMPDGMIVLDAEQRIVDLNAAARRALGLDGARITGQPAAEVLAAWPDLLAVDPSTAVSRSLTLPAHDPPRYLDLRVTPVIGRTNKPKGQLIVLRDVTDQKRRQDALRLATAELRVRNDELDAFAQMVAHDLKNPLSLIVGYADLACEEQAGASPEQTRHHMRAILQGAQKMEDIIRELLLLAEVRHQEIQRAPLDMAAIVAESIQRLEGLTRSTKGTIVAAKEWPSALGHAAWIEEVWVNYISNALKYGGRPPRVHLGASRESDHIRFWVQDNGAGLTGAEQSRLFVPFTRLYGVGLGGHGLGLSIVRRIVEKLGGRVAVTSEPGRGSRFSFTLPAQPDGQSRQAVRGGTAPDSRQSPT